MLHSLHLHNGLVPGDENTSLATRPQPGLRHLEALLLESPQATCSILLVEKTKEEPWIKTQGHVLVKHVSNAPLSTKLTKYEMDLHGVAQGCPPIP